MHQELDQVLCSKYPKIFLTDVLSSQAFFGFECGDGWFKLIDAACSLIQADSSTEDQQFFATQLKEKFGGLRFYYRNGNGYADSVTSLIESLSFHVCEVCGDPGKRVSLYGWVQTRCQLHGNSPAFHDSFKANGRVKLLIDPTMGPLLHATLALFDLDSESAARWLTQPAKALGGIPPLSLAGSAEGLHKVINVIGRLEHGIPQ